MKITVKPGHVQISAIVVRRHTGGIYTVQIATPFAKHVGLTFGSSVTPPSRETAQDVFLYAPLSLFVTPIEPTRVSLTPESNDEEEALMEGLFDVLDDLSRYSVTLIAVPAAILEESEEVATWHPPAGPIDYLET